MIKFRLPVIIMTFNLLSSSFQIKAEKFQVLDENKWTIGLGACLSACSFAGIMAFGYSIHEQEILEREVPAELEKVKDDTYDLNNPVVQKIVTDRKGNRQKDFYKIHWLNFYKKLHEKDKKVSQELVATYYKRTISTWASMALGIAGLVALLPALVEQNIIE